MTLFFTSKLSSHKIDWISTTRRLLWLGLLYSNRISVTKVPWVECLYSRLLECLWSMYLLLCICIMYAVHTLFVLVMYLFQAHTDVLYLIRCICVSVIAFVLSVLMLNDIRSFSIESPYYNTHCNCYFPMLITHLINLTF